MESLWTTAVLFLIGLCNGLPINLENSGPDPHTQFLTGLVAVLLTICSVVLLAGCLCCQRKNGFKDDEKKQEFRDGPVASSATIIASNQDHGHVNPIANSSSEFTIFTPISPPHHNNNVFLANQRIVNCSQEDYKDGDIDATSWFDGSEKDFPRTKLKYIRELGKGWFGRVVEGTAQNISEDPSDPEWTPVVVRILEASATSREKLLFLNDAAIYKRGYHPNILRILGRSLDTVPLLLLQEYCPQGDLKKYLRMCKSSQDKLVAEDMPLRWCYHLTLALKFLHDQKLTHPDLAARNCQLSEDLSLKLGDYGLSAVYYPEDYYQGSPGVPLRWCAPEIISYTSTTIQTTPTTTESNVWALGVAMWEILEWGEQPYVGLTDDEVISQVLGAPKVRLTRPTYRLIYTEYLYKIMQSCWYNVESRVTVSQIDLMMTDLMHVFENTKLSLDLNSDMPHEGEPISLEDFDMRWNALKPNSPLTKEAESLELRPNQNQQKQDRAQKSASLNNLHGSLDNLLDTRQFDPMESWLENVASDTSDMSFVRGLSEAITDLDNAIAMQNMSSSPEFGKAKVAGGTQFTSSESETEDENWRKKIERGAYTEKVRQKSRSVADLMILTHIDCSESDSETLPSLDYKVNQQRVRYLKTVDNQKKFGSEGNLFHTHDNTFREELKKLQEERRDSLLFVPDKFSECSFSEEGVTATGNNRLDSLENSPVKKLMEKLNSPSEMVPPQQVYNVFNVRVRHVNVAGAVCDKVRENASRSVDIAADTICDRQLESKVLELEQCDNKLYNQNDGSPSHIKTVYDPFEDAELTRNEGRCKTGVTFAKTYPSKKREDKVSVAYKPNSTNEKIVRSETVGEFKCDPIVDYNLSKGHAIDASKEDNNFEVKIEILNEQKKYDNVTNDVSPKEISVTSKENSKNIKLKVPKLSEIIQRNAIDYKVHHHHHHHSGSNDKTSVIPKSEENEKAVHQEIIDKDSGLNTPENSASLEKLYDDNEEILDIGSFDSDRSNETTNNRGVLLTDISNEDESSAKEKQDDKEEISEIIDFCIKNETRLICDLFLAHERANHLDDCKKENVCYLAKKYAFFDYDYRNDMQNFIDTEVYHSSNLLDRPRLLGALENDKMMVRCIDVNMKESEHNAIGVNENCFGDTSKQDVLHGFNTKNCGSTRLELEVLRIGDKGKCDNVRLLVQNEDDDVRFENINDKNAFEMETGQKHDDDNSREFPACSVSEEKFKNQNISPNLSKIADNQKNTSDQVITVVNDKIISGKCVKFDECLHSVVSNDITPVKLESDLSDEKMAILKAAIANPSNEKLIIFKEITANPMDEGHDSNEGINLFDTDKNEESTREETKRDENLHTTKLFLDKEIENYIIRKDIDTPIRCGKRKTREGNENRALTIDNETGQNISITVEDKVAKHDAKIKMEENHTSALISDDKNNVNNSPRLINDCNQILIAAKCDPQVSDDRNTSKVIEEIKTCKTSKLDLLENTIDVDSNLMLNDSNQILIATGCEPQIGDHRNTLKVIQETTHDHPLNLKLDRLELSNEPNPPKCTEYSYPELLKDCDYFSPKTQSNELDCLGCIKHVDSEPSIGVNHINGQLARLRDVDVNCDSIKDSELQIGDNGKTLTAIQETTEIRNDSNQILVAMGCDPQISDDRNTLKAIQETTDDHPLNLKLDRLELSNEPNPPKCTEYSYPELLKDCDYFSPKTQSNELDRLGCIKHVDSKPSIGVNHINSQLARLRDVDVNCDSVKDSELLSETGNDTQLCGSLNKSKQIEDVDSLFVKDFEQIGLERNDPVCGVSTELGVLNDIQLPTDCPVVAKRIEDVDFDFVKDSVRLFPETNVQIHQTSRKSDSLNDTQLCGSLNNPKQIEDVDSLFVKDFEQIGLETNDLVCGVSTELDLLNDIQLPTDCPVVAKRIEDVDFNFVKDSVQLSPETNVQIHQTSRKSDSLNDTQLCGSLNKSKQIEDGDSFFVKDFEQSGPETNHLVCGMSTELDFINDIQLPTDCPVVAKRIEDVHFDFVKDSVPLSPETNVQTHQTSRKSDSLNDTQLCGSSNNPKQIEDVDSLFVKGFEQSGLETNHLVCGMSTELDFINDIQLPTDCPVVAKRIEDVEFDFVKDSVRLSPETNVQIHQTDMKPNLDLLKHIESHQIFPKPSIEVYHQKRRKSDPLKDIEDIRFGLTQESDHFLLEPSNDNRSGTEQKHSLSEFSNDNQPSTEQKHIEDVNSDLIKDSNKILPDKQVNTDRWDTYLIRERTTVFLSNEIINYEDADAKGVHDLTPTDQFVLLIEDKSDVISSEEPNFEDAIANYNKDRNQIDEVLESSVDDVAVGFNNFNQDFNMFWKEENAVVYLGGDQKSMKSDQSLNEAKFKMGNTNIYSLAEETKAVDGVTNYNRNSDVEISKFILSDLMMKQTLAFLKNEIENYNTRKYLLGVEPQNQLDRNPLVDTENLNKLDLKENMQSRECDKVFIEKSDKLEAVDHDDNSEGNQPIQNDHRLEDSNAEHIYSTNFNRDLVSKQTQTFLKNEIENYGIFHKKMINLPETLQNQLDTNPFVGTLDNTQELAIECLEPEKLIELNSRKNMGSPKLDKVLIDGSDKLEAVDLDDASEENQQIENCHRLHGNNAEDIHSTNFSRGDPVSKNQTETFLNNEIENYGIFNKRTTNSRGIKPQNQLDPNPLVGILDDAQDLGIESLKRKKLNEFDLGKNMGSLKLDKVLIDGNVKLEAVDLDDAPEENDHRLEVSSAKDIPSTNFIREDPVAKQTQTFLYNEIENYAISGKEATNLVESEAQYQLVESLGNVLHFPPFECLESEQLNELGLEENVESKRFDENLINETYKLEETDLDDVSEGSDQIEHYHPEDNNIQSTTFTLKEDSVGEQTKTFLSNEIENYGNFDNRKIEPNRNILEAEQILIEATDDTHRRIEFNQNILDTSFPSFENLNRSDEIHETSTFLQNEIENYAGNERRVDFDLSDTQEKISLNSLTHISTFTSTPFANRRPNDSAVILGASDDYSIDYYSGLKTSVDPEEGADLQFSSNFVRPSNAPNDLYSLETWDNFLGRSFDEQESATVDFNDFSQEPHSLLFLECDENSGKHANELTMTKVLEETYNAGDVPGSNETFVVEKKEEENVDDQIETDPCKNTTNTSTTGGWFLHPQTKESSNKTEESTPPTTATTTTTTTTTTATTTTATGTTTTREESYVGFSMDDEIMAAIRNELLTKLPHAQRASSDHQIEENCEEMDSAERNEVFLRYNVYNTPLSPIPEESCDSDVASGRITPERINDTSDDEGDSSDWSVQEDNNSSNARTEEIISPRMPESPAKCRTDPYRHTPSQDSCCSNDTLFNVEELNAVPNDRTLLDPVLNLVHQLDSIEDETGESKYVDCSGDTLLTSNENAISSPGGEPKLELPEIRTEHGYILDFLDNERYCEMNTSLDAGEEVSSTSDIYLTVSENTFSFGQNVAPLNSPEDRPWKELQASFRDCDEDDLPKISPLEETKNSLKRDDSLNDVNDTLDTSTPPQQDIPDPITPQAPNETELKDSSCVLRLDEGEESDDCLISDEDIDKVLREDMESEIISNEKLEKDQEDAISRSPGSNPSDGGIYVNVNVPDPDVTNEIAYKNIDKEENHGAVCDDDLYVNLFETQPDTDDRIYANLTKTESGESFNTEDSNGTDSVKVGPVAGYENLTSTARDEDAIYSKIDDTDDSDNSKFSRFEDLFGPLTDIRFSGPGNSSQMMATSFSESCDLGEDQDWDSGSDTRSSSSGEFIWKEGEHEASVKALRAPPQVENVDYVTPMENIQEEEIVDSNSKDNSSSGSSSGSEGEDECPEFVPSAWDKYATPTKSALRSPEKTLERSKEEKTRNQRTTPKEKKSKGVWFKKQKYHCVYEYPREPESPVLQSYDLWKPTPDYATLSDWDLDAEAYLPVSLGNPEVHDTQSLRENLPRNLYHLNTFSDINVDSNVLDEDFFVSSSSKPFDMLTGLTSQFFPGRQFPGDAWADGTNVTPDSGVEDVATPATFVDDTDGSYDNKNRIEPPPPPSPSPLTGVQSLKVLAANAAERNGSTRHTAAEEIVTRQVPTFTTFGKSRFLVQHVDTPPECGRDDKNVSFEALPHRKPDTQTMLVDTGKWQLLQQQQPKRKIESVRGEASLLDSADEDSGIESCTIDRKRFNI